MKPLQKNPKFTDWSAPIRTEQINKLLSDEIPPDELEKMRKAQEKRDRKANKK
jgi:hypothetical protein